MKSSTGTFSRFKKIKRAMALLTVVLCLTACGKNDGDKGQTTVTLAKDGTVVSSIIEGFEQSYYDQEELQQRILSETATYNRSVGSGNISVEKVAVDGSRAEVKMTYASAEDYADFNRILFFVGTPEEADAVGNDLNVVLSGVKDSSDTIGKSDLLKMKDVTLLITDTEDTVILPGKAVYVSDNVVVGANQKSVSLLTAEEEGGAGAMAKQEIIYVLYK